MRSALLGAARELESHGLNHGHAGNISVRYGDGMLITPSGITADALSESDMVAMALDGDFPPGQRKPSSEWRFHAAVYQARRDIGAVVHAHPPHATALACARRGIPAFHYTVALSGAAGIPCAAYATFGSAELATSVIQALGRNGQACLMANHGMLTAAPDLDAALMLAREVEYLSQVYALSLQVGPPAVLDNEEMARVLQRIRGYGQQT